MVNRAFKTDEEIAGIPLDQEIMIELPDGVSIETDKPAEKKTAPSDPDAKTLQEQLEALQATQRADRERADRAESEVTETRRIASLAAREAQEARQRSAALEGDIITGGLSAAQGERDAAKQSLQQAGEMGDWKAIADAQSRISRAEAKILAFESGAAEVAERREARPEQREQPRQQSWAESVRSNQALMSSEREWMLRNEGSFKDPDFARKIDFAYQGAIQKGVVRGSPEYFDHIERATGLKQPTGDEGNISMQAPPSRSERSVDGSSSSNRVTLTPDERDMCKNMGISEIEYARQKVRMGVEMKNDPAKYNRTS